LWQGRNDSDPEAHRAAHANAVILYNFIPFQNKKQELRHES